MTSNAQNVRSDRLDQDGAARMRPLLALQRLDSRIAEWKRQATRIPEQKRKFLVQKERFQAELTEREERFKARQLEQRNLEVEIDQIESQIEKYRQQLNLVKKNEEYTALLHEIETLQKQIASKEERVIALLVEIDEGKESLDEDRKRIQKEMSVIDRECAAIDEELAQAERECEALEAQRAPLAEDVDNELLGRYERIRQNNHRGGPAVVPLKGEVCGGCHMHLRAQTVNEILAGEKIHSCQHCGRLLFCPDLHSEEEQVAG